MAKGTTVPGLYSHIAHSGDKDKTDIPQPFKGACPKQPKSRGGGKGKQPQQKPKNLPPQIQDNQYNYEDTNNYYHNENYRGQSRGCRPYRGQNTGHFFRGQNFHGRGQQNQNPYQGQYQNDSYQGNNYQGNHGFYHNPCRNFSQGYGYGHSRGRSHGRGRNNYHGHGRGRSNYGGNANYQYHLYYGHDEEYQTEQYGPPCALCGGHNHSPKHCFKGEHDIILTAINYNQVVYIPKGEHDNPHELPQQQDLEGSTKIDHTLYSHSDTTRPTPNPLQKLDYIYQHFQDNKKIYESDPNVATCKTDNILYPHINNNIEYDLFKDIIDSYYLDSQIKDDFTCDQNCYRRTQHKQQDQTLTPYTHAYDHITQHIDNLQDPTQHHTVYTNEVDASLFTMDTTTPCNYNISTDILNMNNLHESKTNTTQSMGIHSQSKHKYRNVFGNANIQYHDFGNGDALTFKDKYTVLYSWTWS